MSTVTSDVEVNVPVGEVYGQWTQFESLPQFMDGVDEVKQLDDTHTHWKVSIGGVDREFDATILEQVPDTRIAWKSDDEPAFEGTVNFEKVEADKTRVQLEINWEPSGFVEKSGALLQADDIEVDRSLRSFKDKIESNGFVGGGWRGEVDHGQDQAKPGLGL